MQRVDEIMEELGFKKDGSDRVKVAFVKNLIKAATGKDVPIPEAIEKRLRKQEEVKEEQLSLFEKQSS